MIIPVPAPHVRLASWGRDYIPAPERRPAGRPRLVWERDHRFMRVSRHIAWARRRPCHAPCAWAGLVSYPAEQLHVAIDKRKGGLGWLMECVLHFELLGACTCRALARAYRTRALVYIARARRYQKKRARVHGSHVTRVRW